MSEAVPQAKCAKPRVNHAWMAGFVAVNGPWARMTRKLIRINDWIGELWVLFQSAGELSGKCQLNCPLMTLLSGESRIRLSFHQGEKSNDDP
ncbi:MAG: hypothetical protein IID48_03985 [Proteobacteria bacterium]|nr:hypothetical protein [Pseudomonadota bacterium]